MSPTPKGKNLKKRVIKQLSKADYTVYVIESPDIGIISVVIEAKHTGNPTIYHAIVQVVGYFAGFNIVQTPLVFVLTEEYVQIVYL